MRKKGTQLFNLTNPNYLRVLSVSNDLDRMRLIAGAIEGKSIVGENLDLYLTPPTSVSRGGKIIDGVYDSFYDIEQTKLFSDVSCSFSSGRCGIRIIDGATGQTVWHPRNQ